ncbi:DUF350 domain-containing protein [Shewanella sp. JM162201]|uniref:DUF350 domain-containing protein n=1 Tax=Shewanella jiangmenensis TaxID=2837387 RepID=A0ABS5V9D3_9GAMM|nr:DUF350 domain-containing protein [Shewanella jiangmenensis]MBT1446570.1 DUF350 domain-containing protein [Shewanella jiangmenensis]
MLDTLYASAQGLPAFAAYFGLAAAALLLFARIYSWLTPHHELALIREGNSAAAIAFGGALIGFALPLSSAIKNSLSLPDCALWALVALLVQLLTFVCVRLTLRQLPARISNGDVAAGVFMASVAIAVGLLNAASMTY